MYLESTDVVALADRRRVVGSMLAAGARALDVDGDLRAGRRWFESAYQVAERAGDTAAMTASALGLGGLRVHEHRTGAVAAVLELRLRRLLSLVESGSPVGLRIRARLAAEADYRAGESGTILEVLAAAGPGTDAVVRAEALSLAHHCLLGPEHDTVRRSLAVELIAESARTGRRRDLLMGLLWQTVDLFLGGDRHAERRLSELRAELARHDHRAVGFVVSAIEVMLAIRAGRLDEAEAAAHACAQRGAAAGDVDAGVWHGAQLVAIRWYQGRLAELLPVLTELVHSPTLSAVDDGYFAALAVAAAMAGDRRTAVGALARLRGRSLADIPRSTSWLVTMHGVVEAAYLLDDPDTAVAAYELLRPFAGLPAVAGLGVACFGSVHHALGVASLTTGDIDRAVDHLTAAVEHNAALGHWPAVAVSRARLASALARRGWPRDEVAAREQRDAAAAEAAALGVRLPDDTGPDIGERLAICTRESQRWRVDWAHRSVLVDNSVGMLHLAVLLANPGVEIPAIDLAHGVAELANTAGARMSPQPVLDDTARHQYQRRLARLRAEIAELEAFDEHQRASRARAEYDRLTAELARALGLGGRSRRFSGNPERARVAVGKAIRRAISRIDRADGHTGQHLRNAVRTGVRCSYQPA
jgi:hypothetical protein